MKKLIPIVLCFTFSSCSFLENILGGKEQPIARVHDKYLYPADLGEIIPDGTSKEDSALLVQTYIENWMKQEVILKHAESNVELNKAEIEAQLENYRQSLIIYSYEQQLVSQKLDTNVSETEIKKYYESNKDNFELKQSIVKVSYAKLVKNAPRIELAKKWFTSVRPRDRAELETFCMQFSPDYNLSDTTWMVLDELSKIVPLEKLSESSIMQSNNFIQLSDNEFLYLIKVRDYMYKEDFSPLEFERENIRNIIINKRKVDLVNRMENDVYEKARKDKDAEIYSDEK